ADVTGHHAPGHRVMEAARVTASPGPEADHAVALAAVLAVVFRGVTAELAHRDLPEPPGGQQAEGEVVHAAHLVWRRCGGGLGPAVQAGERADVERVEEQARRRRV